MSPTWAGQILGQCEKEDGVEEIQQLVHPSSSM